jgi:hypothetical protein
LSISPKGTFATGTVYQDGGDFAIGCPCSQPKKNPEFRIQNPESRMPVGVSSPLPRLTLPSTSPAN